MVKEMNNSFFALHLFCCFFMTGLIWTIQVVHYPSFYYTKESFSIFHTFHSQRISYLVIPIMLAELATAIYLMSMIPMGVSNLILLILTWVATFLLSVPYHNQLEHHYSESLIRGLVLTNWARTLLWSVRSGYWLYFLASALRI